MLGYKFREKVICNIFSENIMEIERKRYIQNETNGKKMR